MKIQWIVGAVLAGNLMVPGEVIAQAGLTHNPRRPHPDALALRERGFRTELFLNLLGHFKGLLPFSLGRRGWGMRATQVFA